MKPLSQLKQPGIENHSCRGKSARVLPSVREAAALILVFTLLNGHAAAEPMGACQLTANAVLRSCRRAAQSDYWLALAKCDNLASPAAQDCRKQASADLKDARQSCREQSAVRQAACGRLGEGRYDPVINPSNFVAQIDNPYFPLTPGTVFTAISNTSANPISGTFSNLADGSVFTANGNNFEASYEGGDGNDLTLTVVP